MASARILLVIAEHAHRSGVVQAIENDVERPIEYETRTTLAQALSALACAPPDLVLLELDLPDSGGEKTLRDVTGRAGDTPVVVLIDRDQDLAVRCIELGAQDCLFKESAGENVTSVIHNAITRARMQRSLSAAYENIRRMVADNRDPILVLGEDHIVLFSNEAARTLFEGKVVPGVEFGLPLAGEVPQELDVPRSNGDTATVEMRVSDTQWYGEPGFVVSFRDVTERNRVERERLRMQREMSQNNKLQALGQLTGGIAHDFNNILGIITGFATVALKRRRSGRATDDTAYLEKILAASDRGRTLVEQMLAFSRNEIGEGRRMQLSAEIRENVDLLRSVIPSSIELVLAIDDGVPEVIMDPVGLQQVIVNLCVNARDAVGDAGRVEVALGVVELEDGECASCHQRLVGRWVRLALRDSGAGIDDDVKQNIFEPFFSTKEVGRGSGMGLAVVQGVTHRFRAHVTVDSIEGQGTEFGILFPVAVPDTHFATLRNAGREHRAVIADDDMPGGRVLIVDDERDLAIATGESLESYGFDCRLFSDSRVALEHILGAGNDIEAIVTDQAMPQLTGLEMVRQIRDAGLTMPVVLVTGYSDRIDHDELQALDVSILLKPVDPEQLAGELSNKIRGDLVDDVDEAC